MAGNATKHIKHNIFCNGASILLLDGAGMNEHSRSAASGAGWKRSSMRHRHPPLGLK
jgi:hypothetical protein